MAKTHKGTVVSVKMQNTAVVEISWKAPHPLYKKLLKRSKKHKVDTAGQEVQVGDVVTIIETKPISKDKHFVLAKGDEK
jgi:small subunit ribosomal protein S17